MEKKEYLKPAVTKIELDDVQIMAAAAPLLEMDFAFFAIAFNLKKMCRKLNKAV